MARRSSSGFYDTIEYIGPRPQKPKKSKPFGGWIIGVIALTVAIWVGKPFMTLFAAEERASRENAERCISALERSKKPGDQLACVALDATSTSVTFDDTPYPISYPAGDVPSDKGMAGDLIVRAYRKLGIDLQKEVHNDMVDNYRSYPQIYQQFKPDTNIDHRRVPNLQRFFERKAEVVPPSSDAADFRPGDIVVWLLPSGGKDIGIVVPGPNESTNEAWVVRFDKDKGVVWENELFQFPRDGHYRYPVIADTVN